MKHRKRSISPEEKRKAYMKEYRKKYTKPRVTVVLEESEYREFEKLAEQEGVGVATVIRNMAIAYRQSNTLNPKEIETQLQSLHLLLAGVANNFNQIARKVNVGDIVAPEEVLAYIKQMDAIIREHTKKKTEE